MYTLKRSVSERIPDYLILFVILALSVPGETRAQTPVVDSELAGDIAGFEMNARLYSALLDFEGLTGCRFVPNGVPIFDLDGQLLFFRVPLYRGNQSIGYADIGADSLFSAPLFGYGLGIPWDPQSLVKEARTALTAVLSPGDSVAVQDSPFQFVDYSHPYIGLRFTAVQPEDELVDLDSMTPVSYNQLRRQPPTARTRFPFSYRRVLRELRHTQSEPSNYNVFLEEVPDIIQLGKRRAGRVSLFPRELDAMRFAQIYQLPHPRILPLPSMGRVLHYTPVDTTHSLCFERTPQKGVWCVPASVKMVLDFYRYYLSLDAVAAALGLSDIGTAVSLGGNKSKETAALMSSLTDSALVFEAGYGEPELRDIEGEISEERMNALWDTLVQEIRDNHPVISVRMTEGNHARVVVGYDQFPIYRLIYDQSGERSIRPVRGLKLMDPKAEGTSGAIVWESFWDTKYFEHFFSRLQALPPP